MVDISIALLLFNIMHLQVKTGQNNGFLLSLILLACDEIGYFTYFGEVGTMFGFKTKSISNDQCIRMSIADSTGLISPTPSSASMDMSLGTSSWSAAQSAFNVMVPRLGGQSKIMRS